MKITNEKILEFNKALDDVSRLPGAKFAYAVARNIEKLHPEIVSLNKSFAPTEAYNAYDKQRAGLAEKHSVKVNGQPKIENNGYVIEDQEKFDAEIALLKETHKATIEEREKQNKEFTEILKQEVDIELFMIPPIYLPDSITAEQINGILPMIEGEKK